MTNCKGESKAEKNHMRQVGKWAFAAISLTASIGFFATASKAGPIPYSMQEIVRIHQNKFPVAGDLKFKFWQKEDDIEVTSWEVLGTSGGLPPPDKVERGDQPGGDDPKGYHKQVDKLHHNSNPEADNGKHAVDLSWDNLNLPKSSDVDIKFKWTLTEYNVKHKEWVWSNKDAPAEEKKGGAKVGVEVKDPVPDGGGNWIHVVNILNLDRADEDDPMPILIRDLKFWAMLNNDPIDIDTLENWTNWSSPFPDILLLPGELFQFGVVTPAPYTRILGDYLGIDPASNEWLIRDTWDHTAPIPEPGTMILMGTGLTGLIFSRKKRRPKPPFNA